MMEVASTERVSRYAQNVMPNHRNIVLSIAAAVLPRT